MLSAGTTGGGSAEGSCGGVSSGGVSAADDASLLPCPSADDDTDDCAASLDAELTAELAAEDCCSLEEEELELDSGASLERALDCSLEEEDALETTEDSDDELLPVSTVDPLPAGGSSGATVLPVSTMGSDGGGVMTISSATTGWKPSGRMRRGLRSAFQLNSIRRSGCVQT